MGQTMYEMDEVTSGMTDREKDEYWGIYRDDECYNEDGSRKRQ